MVAVARAMGHYKETFWQKAYVPFNAKDFSLPRTYLKKERLDAEKHFNYRSRLQPSESGEFGDDQTDSDTAADTRIETQAGPSNPDPISSLSPSRNPTPPPSPTVPNPCPLSIPIPPAPRSFFISKTTLQECAKIGAKPLEARPEYLCIPLLDESLSETPLELISDQPLWRKD